MFKKGSAEKVGQRVRESSDMVLKRVHDCTKIFNIKEYTGFSHYLYVGLTVFYINIYGLTIFVFVLFFRQV